MSSSLTRQDYQKWSASLLFSILMYMVPLHFGISPEGSAFLGITIFAICAWGFGILPDGLVAVMLPMFYILAGIGSPAQVLSSWQTSVLWLVFGGLMTGLILQQTGLAHRIALWTLRITGGSFHNLLWGLLLAGFIITPLMPTNVGKCIIFGIICISICDAMKFAPKSREASVILIAGFLAVQGPRIGVFTASGEMSYGVELLQNTGVSLSWLEFISHNFIPCIIYSIANILLLIFVLKVKTPANAKQWIEEQYKELGPMSFAEKKATLLFILLIVLMMTDQYHGINSGWIMMIIGFAGFLPGLNLIDHKKFATINLQPILFMAGCMSIGAAAKACGMDKQLAAMILPLLQEGSEITTLIFTYFVGIGLNFLLTPLAALSVFAEPLFNVAGSLGIDPKAICYSFLVGLDQYILPYEATPLLYIFSTGYIKLKDLVVLFSWRMLLCLILLCCVFYPYWILMGVA